MKTARFLCGLVAMSLVLASSPAWAQRPQFATPVESTPGASASGATATPLPSTPYAAPSAPSVYPTPPLSPSVPPPSSTFVRRSAPPLPPAGPRRCRQRAPASPPAPGSIYTPPPGLASCRDGSGRWLTQPPPATWDPYATPGNTPSALLQQDPCFQSSPTISMAAMQKFVQHINLNYDWFAGNPSRNRQRVGHQRRRSERYVRLSAVATSRRRSW